MNYQVPHFLLRGGVFVFIVCKGMLGFVSATEGAHGSVILTVSGIDLKAGHH